VTASGPLDETERHVSLIWNAIGVGILFLSLALIGSAGIYTYLQQREVLFGLAVMALACAWVLSFLLLRLRRVILAAPGGNLPATAARRRRHFGAGVLVGVVALVFLSGGSAATRIIQDRAARERIQREAQELAAQRWRDEESARRRAAEEERAYALATAAREATAQRLAAEREAAADRLAVERARIEKFYQPPCRHSYLPELSGGEWTACNQGHRYRRVRSKWKLLPPESPAPALPPSQLLLPG
jgi:hypothetical protein